MLHKYSLYSLQIKSPFYNLHLQMKWFINEGKEIKLLVVVKILIEFIFIISMNNLENQ